MQVVSAGQYQSASVSVFRSFRRHCREFDARGLGPDSNITRKILESKLYSLAPLACTNTYSNLEF